jgi:23S rRNA (adenine-N6)-dimethyltransferase
VIAIETHPARIWALRHRFGAQVVIVQADASDLRLPRRPYYVVSNPPFAITTALLRRLVQPGSRLIRADLVAQDQAARRWSTRAAPGAARWQQHFRATLGAPIPRAAFRPPPAVNARVLTIERWGR